MDSVGESLLPFLLPYFELPRFKYDLIYQFNSNYCILVRIIFCLFLIPFPQDLLCHCCILLMLCLVTAAVFILDDI